MSDLTAMTADSLAEKVASVIATAAFHANEEGRQLDYSDLHQADGFLAELARRAAALPAAAGMEELLAQTEEQVRLLKARAEAAEARCAELEKERDEARAERDSSYGNARTWVTKAASQVEAAEARCAELEKERDEAVDELATELAEERTLHQQTLARVTTLKAALERYGGHRRGCRSLITEATCDCGWAAALQEEDECEHAIPREACVFHGAKYVGKDIRDGFCPNEKPSSTWHIVHADGTSECCACRHTHPFEAGLMSTAAPQEETPK